MTKQDKKKDTAISTKIKRVFVYGTLRKGWGLNRYIQNYKGELISKEMLSGYQMYSLSAYPAIYPEEGARVVGEIYEFPDVLVEQALKTLDMIELGAGYRREVITLLDEPTYVYVYSAPLSSSGLKKMEDWTEEARRY